MKRVATFVFTAGADEPNEDGYVPLITDAKFTVMISAPGYGSVSRVLVGGGKVTGIELPHPHFVRGSITIAVKYGMKTIKMPLITYKSPYNQSTFMSCDVAARFKKLRVSLTSVTLDHSGFRCNSRALKFCKFPSARDVHDFSNELIRLGEENNETYEIAHISESMYSYPTDIRLEVVTNYTVFFRRQ